jgi:hypothetical protein
VFVRPFELPIGKFHLPVQVITGFSVSIRLATMAKRRACVVGISAHRWTAAVYPRQKAQCRGQAALTHCIEWMEQQF